MSESIFRKKNLDAMKSPDTLDKYIHVANPTGWILMAAILCLLIGVLVWGMFGKIESTVATHVRVENGEAVGTLLPGEMEAVRSGMPVRIGEQQGTVWAVSDEDNTITAKITIPDGAYDAVIVTETIKPISLIFD